MSSVAMVWRFIISSAVSSESWSYKDLKDCLRRIRLRQPHALSAMLDLFQEVAGSTAIGEELVARVRSSPWEMESAWQALESEIVRLLKRARGAMRYTN
jgi:hypothetical protein